jgi:hypothetical protein
VALVAGVLLGWTLEKAALEGRGIGGWLRSFTLAALAIAAPVVAAAAAMRGAALPSFAQVLGGADRRPDRLAFVLGLVLVALCAMALQLALGLVFDPRYRDFAFPALTAATAPYLLLAFMNPRDFAHVPAKACPGLDPGWSPVRRREHAPRKDSSARPDSKGKGQAPGPRGLAERITAVVLALSAVYVVLNESFANWQAVWFCAALAALVIVLLLPAAARSSG